VMAILRAKAALWPLLNDRTGSGAPEFKLDFSISMRSKQFATIDAVL
jgi:hypothetical protein